MARWKLNVHVIVIGMSFWNSKSYVTPVQHVSVLINFDACQSLSLKFGMIHPKHNHKLFHFFSAFSVENSRVRSSIRCTQHTHSTSAQCVNKSSDAEKTTTHSNCMYAKWNKSTTTAAAKSCTTIIRMCVFFVLLICCFKCDLYQCVKNLIACNMNVLFFLSPFPCCSFFRSSSLFPFAAQSHFVMFCSCVFFSRLSTIILLLVFRSYVCVCVCLWAWVIDSLVLCTMNARLLNSWTKKWIHLQIHTWNIMPDVFKVGKTKNTRKKTHNAIGTKIHTSTASVCLGIFSCNMQFVQNIN